MRFTSWSILVNKKASLVLSASIKSLMTVLTWVLARVELSKNSFTLFLNSALFLKQLSNYLWKVAKRFYILSLQIKLLQFLRKIWVFVFKSSMSSSLCLFLHSKQTTWSQWIQFENANSDAHDSQYVSLIIWVGLISSICCKARLRGNASSMLALLSNVCSVKHMGHVIFIRSMESFVFPAKSTSWFKQLWQYVWLPFI